MTLLGQPKILPESVDGKQISSDHENVNIGNKHNI